MIELTVNNEAHSLQADPDQPLLWVLRDALGLKGTKYGCGVGVCGICVVHVDGQPVRACTTTVGENANRHITTIEGISPQHPVVQAWVAAQVPQCGYCQPGQVMMAMSLLQSAATLSQSSLEPELSTVLCRCGTYPRIRRAIRRAQQLLRQGENASQPGPSPPVSIPNISADLDTDPSGVYAPNPWIRIHRDGTVTIVIDRAEMGQGVITGLAVLVAEELEVDLNQVRAVFAPAAEAYCNPIIGEQLTGGSTSIRGSWNHLRKAGASTRDTLIRAAAQIWGAPTRDCRAQRGHVLHLPSGQTLGYGALIETARSLEIPEKVPLKDPQAFRLIGQSTPRLDAAELTLGQVVYGIDVCLPHMLFATVARCPTLGGKLKNYDASTTLQVDGVARATKVPTGVAVLANSNFAALKGRAALELEWDPGPNAELSSASIRQQFAAAAQRKGVTQRSDGNASRALERGFRVMEAVYETPFLAHGCMEPLNCTVWIQDSRCDVWVGTQAQTATQKVAAEVAGLPIESVHVHTQYLGGGFGRRGDTDFVREAVQVAQVIDRPIQLLWTRQDDFQYDRFRPANSTLLKAALDQRGRPTAWFQRVVGPPLALDGVTVPYAIPNVSIEFVEEDPKVPTSAWRAVGASQNAFSIECFVDELAHASGEDPLEYRLSLLKDEPRYTNVLSLAAEKANWTSGTQHGAYQGIACYRSYKSTVAQVAEVSVTNEGTLAVHRVVCAIDCGIAVNPDQVAAQVEGAIVFGLSAALHGEITVKNGQIQQSTFADFPILTLAQTPKIEVHILPSRKPPCGVGEPGVPPIAPAVANAVFAATGQRLRSLPLRVT